ncbi:hypothetical protein ACFW4X_10790 [Streptomyces smyrnaeus]|uniref:hypothetical protein n=1 Tax=Streptomyces smyrnaeus TaxID=1387713 RepID=UPI00367BF71B
MARVRYIGARPVTVPELGGRAIEPDQVVEVPDERFDGYVCQPTVWEPIEEPREPEPAAPAAMKKTAAKPRKEG